MGCMSHVLLYPLTKFHMFLDDTSKTPSCESLKLVREEKDLTHTIYVCVSCRQYQYMDGTSDDVILLEMSRVNRFAKWKREMRTAHFSLDLQTWQRAEENARISGSRARYLRFCVWESLAVWFVSARGDLLRFLIHYLRFIYPGIWDRFKVQSVPSA